ncbi:MAG TPA: hypothetical protein PLN95_02675 [Candidatus Saccharibacteria bacterium]|nr:hypothetical protein [Candidatus Saccharibacteria bacterium]
MVRAAGVEDGLLLGRTVVLTERDGDTDTVGAGDRHQRDAADAGEGLEPPLDLVVRCDGGHDVRHLVGDDLLLLLSGHLDLLKCTRIRIRLLAL